MNDRKARIREWFRYNFEKHPKKTEFAVGLVALIIIIGVIEFLTMLSEMQFVIMFVVIIAVVVIKILGTAIKFWFFERD